MEELLSAQAPTIERFILDSATFEEWRRRRNKLRDQQSDPTGIRASRKIDPCGVASMFCA